MKIIMCILVLLAISLVWADVKIDAYVDKNKIGINDRLKLTVEISGSEADKPEFDLKKEAWFTVISQSSSQSSSYSIVNGKMSQSKTLNYIYYLAPKLKGNLLISSQSIKYKGKVYATRPIGISVVEGSLETAPATRRNMRRGQNNQQTNTQSDKVSDNLFLIATYSTTGLYVGQPLTVSYILYTAYNISNLQFGESPEYVGLWKEATFTPTTISWTTTNYQGKRYNAMRMSELLLTPQKSGKLTVPPLNLIVDISTGGRSFFDFGSTKQVKVRSKAIPLDVKELPSQNRPTDFSGAIGRFKIAAKVEKQALKTGDSFTYTINLSGEGSFGNFSLPVLPKANHFRFMEPEIKTDKNGIKGSQTIKYLVIAQEEGEFSLPPVAFSYFDSKENKYHTIQTKEFKFKVSAGENIYIPGVASQSTVNREGSDIGFIYKDIKIESFRPFFTYFIYWLIVSCLLISIPVSAAWAVKRKKLATDTNAQRYRAADKAIKRYMKLASVAATEQKVEFYTAAQTGLNNYLTDKLAISRGSTGSEILAAIKDENIQADLQKFFARCNEARFTPVANQQAQISTDFEALKVLVNKISKIGSRKS